MKKTLTNKFSYLPATLFRHPSPTTLKVAMRPWRSRKLVNRLKENMPNARLRKAAMNTLKKEPPKTQRATMCPPTQKSTTLRTKVSFPMFPNRFRN